MFNCYVCQAPINIDCDLGKYLCHRQTTEGGIEYRHLWHGVPGITRAVGGGGGFNGYAETLEDAKHRAEYYINNNPYAAPEVKAGEQAVLEAVEYAMQEGN